MRTITTLGIAALLVTIVAAAWAMTLGSAKLNAPGQERPGTIDPIEMMKDAKGLPAQTTFDLF
jgi:hypothetical protein